MNRIISLSVEDMYIKYTGEAFGATGSHNAVTLRMTFGPAWEGTAKTAYFTDARGDISVALVLGLDTLTEDGAYEVDVPSEALKIAGVATITIKGVLVSGETTTKAITTAAGHFRVLDSELPDSAGNAGTITPSDKEQLQAEIAGLEALFTTAKTAAEEAAANAKASETAAEESAKAAQDTAKSIVTEELSRQTAETARQNAEASRSQGEATRKDAEATRQANETARQNAEKARAEAEQARADENAGIVAQATTQANAAAGSAQTAQNAASTAASAASSASQAAAAASSSATEASASAKAAAESAASVESINKTAQSWAAGGTGTREGEDTDNAKYWAEQAKKAVQPDYQQNDPTAADYIKNRPGGYSVKTEKTTTVAWADRPSNAIVTDPPKNIGADIKFYGYLITEDIEGFEKALQNNTVVVDGNDYFKSLIADAKWIKTNQTYVLGTDFAWDSNTIHCIAVILEDGVVYDGLTYPKKGIYAASSYYPGNGAYNTKGFSSIFWSWTEENIVEIPLKYQEKEVPVFEAVLGENLQSPTESNTPTISDWYADAFTANVGNALTDKSRIFCLRFPDLGNLQVIITNWQMPTVEKTMSLDGSAYRVFVVTTQEVSNGVLEGVIVEYQEPALSPSVKTDDQTQEVGVDTATGKLYTKPGSETTASVFYIDLTGAYPNYTCTTAMADIAAAYAAGRELKCRCAMGDYTAVLPLFLPLPSSNTWVFSGSGALAEMGFAAQSLTIAIVNGAVQASDTQLASKDDIPTVPTALKNPNALTVKTSSGAVTYDGSEAKTVEITGGDDTPDYVLTAADALAKKVTGHIGADNIVFAVMADAHLGVYTDTANAAGRQAGQALQRLNERCALDFVVHAGDYTTGAWNTDVAATLQDNADYQLLIGSKYPGKAIWVVGNHDDAPYQATASRMTQTQVYAAIARKNLASGGVVPDNACYGYTDFPGMRLRVIYLDTHDRRGWASAQVGAGASCDYLNVENISAAQLKWLANHALDFSNVDDPSKWSILVFSHAVLGTSGTYTDPDGTAHPCNTSNAAAILKAYATKKSGIITHGGVDVSYNFTETVPAGIIGCVHGHEHRYANETVGGAFLSICCPNITNGRERASIDGNTYTKTAGTANGTSFCVFSINRADKKIYVDHYGPGIDREFDYTVIDPSAPSYTNLLPSATDTDGSVYNGVGYASGQRLNSSGAAEGYAGMYLTGFIPVSLGDVVHLKNVTWQYGVTSGITSNNQRISFYDSSRNHLGQTNGTGLGGTLSGVKDDNNIWTQFTAKSFSGVTMDNVAYFRICCAGITDESIITVNEEIT